MAYVPSYPEAIESPSVALKPSGDVAAGVVSGRFSITGTQELTH